MEELKNIKDVQFGKDSTETYSVDETLEILTELIKNIFLTIDKTQIRDAKYSNTFIHEVKNALITVAVIKAFGISQESDHYLELIRKSVSDCKTAPNNG